MASSDEYDDQENSDFQMGNGYQYDPEFTEEELAAISSTKQNSKSTYPDNENHEHFCTCGNCIVLPKRRECLCCRTFEHYIDHYITENNSCIISHQDFGIICLHKIVLETAYVVFMKYKKMTGRAPAVLTNRQYRLMAYRQFVSWVRRGQPLGRKNRVILPACVVVKIRKEFPEESGIYEGFHIVDSGSETSQSESESEN